MNAVGTVKANPAIAQRIVGASRNLYGRIAGVDPRRVDFLRLHAVKAGRRRRRRRADAYVVHAYLFAVFIQNEHAAGCVDADFPALLRLFPGLRRRFRRGLLDFYRYIRRRFRLYRHYRSRSLVSSLAASVFAGSRSGFAALPFFFRRAGRHRCIGRSRLIRFRAAARRRTVRVRPAALVLCRLNLCCLHRQDRRRRFCSQGNSGCCGPCTGQGQ